MSHDDTPAHESPRSPLTGRYKALPIAWVATCRRLLVAGGGYETEARIRHALMFDWLSISVVVSRITPALKAFQRRDLRITLHERKVLERDIRHADFVFEDTGSIEMAARVRAWCDTHQKPLNAADKPDLCDLFYMSLLPLGPLVLGISSGGDAPAVAAALRRWLEANLSPGWVMAAQLLSDLRRSLPSGQARIDLLKGLARDESFQGLVAQNNEAGLRELIADAVRRMPT
jgi:siroheme synthase-like protein